MSTVQFSDLENTPPLPPSTGEAPRHKLAKRRENLELELRRLVPKVEEAEAKMRAAFKRWDRHRARCARVEAELQKLDYL